MFVRPSSSDAQKIKTISVSAINAHLVYEKHFRGPLAFVGPKAVTYLCLMVKSAPATKYGDPFSECMLFFPHFIFFLNK